MITFSDYPIWASMEEQQCSEWLKSIAHAHDATIRNLAYSFINDAEIQVLNKKHLAHDYPTDILTFGYREEDRVSGDILVGTETVYHNARDYEVDPKDELDRVLVHGLLHLIGFDDVDDFQKTEMREEEEKCLILRAKFLKKK